MIFATASASSEFLKGLCKNPTTPFVFSTFISSSFAKPEAIITGTEGSILFSFSGTTRFLVETYLFFLSGKVLQLYNF